MLGKQTIHVRSKITVQAEQIYLSAYGRNTVQGEIPGTTPDNPGPDLTLPGEEAGVLELTLPDTGPQNELPIPESFVNEVKKDAKTQVLVEDTEKTVNHVCSLIKQGHFLKLTQMQQTDATWQSYIYNLQRGTMKWLINSSIDTLPTKTNLRLWGKAVNDKCFCGQRQTLNHILNCCPVSLAQGRYTARHDNILEYISRCLNKDKYKCFVDIDGQQTVGGGTLPPSLVVTNLKPDIVIIDQKNKLAAIFELTVPGERRIEVANTLKADKYQHFSRDIQTHTVSLTPFEVGSNTGFITRDNRKRLQSLHKFCSKQTKFKKFVENISAIAVLSSYMIFNHRNVEPWANPGPIMAPFSNQ